MAIFPNFRISVILLKYVGRFSKLLNLYFNSGNSMTPFLGPTDAKFDPLNYFLNGELNIILKLRNLEIGEHNFSIIDEIIY